MPALRRSNAQRPRSWIMAGMVSMSAAVTSRASTAAAGLHPASISAEPNAPEVPKVAADSTASARPALPGADLVARVPAEVTATPL